MDFNILESRRVSIYAPTVKRTICDYELDYCINGDRETFVDDNKYRIKSGDICFRRPGQVACSVGSYESYVLTLDFSMTVPHQDYRRNYATQLQKECTHDLIVNLPTVMTPINTVRISGLFASLAALPDANSQVGKMLVHELLYCLNADIYHDLYEKNKQDMVSVDRIARYINNNFSKRITLDQLAKEAFLDRSYLVRAFKRRYGCTPIKYLINVRLSHAKDLLLNTNLPVYEVAEECGYNTESFFIAQYKEKYGMTPAQHRQFIWNNNENL